MAYVTKLDFFNGNLKLRHLVVALTILDEGSTAAAAKALHISQPAITRLLKETEQILKAPLFERTGSGMKPTATAGPFFKNAQAALAHIRAGARSIDQYSSGEFGTVRIGVYFAGANELLSRSIIRIHTERPNIQVVIRQDTPAHLIDLLADGKLDFILTRTNPLVVDKLPNGETVATEDLITESGIVLAGPKFDPTHTYTLSELLEETWIFPPYNTFLAAQAVKVFERAGLAVPEKVIECSSLSVTSALVNKGNYLGILPSTAGELFTDNHMLDISDFTITGALTMLWAADRVDSPAVIWTQDIFREEAAEFTDPYTNKS